MAKNRSILKIEGTLDEMTFYKSKDGYLVRTKGGVSKNRIMSDPAFARTRENGSEFGHIAQMSKLLRRSILELLQDAKDSRLHSRLVKRLALVKNQDLTSARGMRTVGNGLVSVEGKEVLKGFNFNANSPLDRILLKDFTLDTVTGEIQLFDFNLLQHILVPEGTTHIELRCGFLNLDFGSGVKDLSMSPAVNLALGSAANTQTLTPVSIPTGTGNSLYFLKVSFFQEVNGIQYPLRNGMFNSLELVEIL